MDRSINTITTYHITGGERDFSYFSLDVPKRIGNLYGPGIYLSATEENASLYHFNKTQTTDITLISIDNSGYMDYEFYKEIYLQRQLFHSKDFFEQKAVSLLLRCCIEGQDMNKFVQSHSDFTKDNSEEHQIFTRKVIAYLQNKKFKTKTIPVTRAAKMLLVDIHTDNVNIINGNNTLKQNGIQNVPLAVIYQALGISKEEEQSLGKKILCIFEQIKKADYCLPWKHEIIYYILKKAYQKQLKTKDEKDISACQKIAQKSAYSLFYNTCYDILAQILKDNLVLTMRDKLNISGMFLRHARWYVITNPDILYIKAYKNCLTDNKWQDISHKKWRRPEHTKE